MTHPLTPREKVADRGPAGAVMDALWPILGGDQMDAETWTEISMAVGTALASGSGDHAELVEDAMEALQIIDAFPSNQGEVEGRITEKGDRMIVSCIRDIRRALEALLAENAALRGERDDLKRHRDVLAITCQRRLDDWRSAQAQATEAERKLAEAVQVIRDISETPYTGADWPRSRAATYIASKEAERG